ncbi:MAG: hypothetical protein HQK65_08270 [Desulfamplus sp.]|nr:hypothetical protein [Desulfamplus sp.]
MKKSSNTKTNSPLSELKHLTLFIDKGITHEVSRKIIKLADQLEQQWQQDKVLLTFVKMIRALSDYAASKKSNTHEDVTVLIHSIVDQMDKLSKPPGKNLPVSKKQAILSEEIEKYNVLKQQIRSTPKEDHSEDVYQSEMEDHIISELKSIILSLDWEISDEIIHRLDKEVNRLQRHWQNSKIHLSFLQMFKSIGNYVLSKGSNTHPDSISLLNSLYKNFEQIALNPSMKMEDQKAILLEEMKKFNALKKTISSGRKNKVTPSFVTQEAKPALSPMDDLMGTKSSSNLSPVDDLIEEIHMLQDSGTRTHSLDANTVSHGTGGSPTNPEIKEVIPNRLKNQPIPEIQTRLDAFFDEDESLSELSFADSGEEVVPYKGDNNTPSGASAQDEEISFNDDESISLMDDIVFEDDASEDITGYDDNASYKPTPSIAQPSTEKIKSASDGMVPYDFEDEFFDEEIDPAPSANLQKKQAVSMKHMTEDIQKDKPDPEMEVGLHIPEDLQMTEDMEILEDLKSAVGKCMFHGGVKEAQSITEKISSLEELWKNDPEKIILLKIVRSLTGYFDLLVPAPEDQTLELMLYIVESLEDNRLKSSGVSKSEKSNKPGLIDVFSRYIDFQSTMVKRQPAITTPGQKLSEERYRSATESHQEALNETETLASKEIFYEQPSEEISDIERKLTEPKGFWRKLKHFFGF